MSKRKHTIEEIRSNPNLREQVCSPDPDPKPSDNGGLMDLIFDTIDAGINMAVDTADAGINMAVCSSVFVGWFCPYKISQTSFHWDKLPSF